MRGSLEIVRIYSTSGTTGAPSYIPLTASDVENWLTGSARSYAAWSRARPAHRLDVQRGPVRRRRGARRLRAHRARAHPGRNGNTALSSARSSRWKPEAVVLTPSYAAYLAENHYLRGSSVQRVLVAGEPGGGEPAFRARSSKRAGARR